MAAALSCGTGAGQSARAQQPSAPDALERSIELIKSEFEREAVGSRDPRVTRAASWKAMGLAFLESVAAADPKRYGEFRDRNFEETDLMWADAKTSWDQREIRAMRLCDDVWSRLTALWYSKDSSDEALEDLESVLSRHGVSSGRARTEPAKIAEAKVFWSNRLVVLFPLMAKALAPDQAAALQDVTDDLINNAEVVSERRDIHHQARMDLLYHNNARSLTAMMCLVLDQPSTPYAEDARALRQSWDDYMSNPEYKVADKISVSLITAAQLSFPLAHWAARTR
jgi:hypothetical protein